MSEVHLPDLAYRMVLAHKNHMGSCIKNTDAWAPLLEIWDGGLSIRIFKVIQ